MLLFKKLQKNRRNTDDKAVDVLHEAVDHLKDNPKVVFDPYPVYASEVMKALVILPLDNNYMKNHDKLDEGSIETMSLKELATMYTFIQRGERFSDGHIASYIEDGRLLRLFKRHLELLDK